MGKVTGFYGIIIKTFWYLTSFSIIVLQIPLLLAKKIRKFALAFDAIIKKFSSPKFHFMAQTEDFALESLRVSKKFINLANKFRKFFFANFWRAYTSFCSVF